MISDCRWNEINGNIAATETLVTLGDFKTNFMKGYGKVEENSDNESELIDRVESELFDVES